MWIVAIWGGPSFIGPFDTKAKAKQWMAKAGYAGCPQSQISVCKLNAPSNEEDSDRK